MDVNRRWWQYISYCFVYRDTTNSRALLLTTVKHQPPAILSNPLFYIYKLFFTSDNDARLYVSVPTHKCKPSLLNGVVWFGGGVHILLLAVLLLLVDLIYMDNCFWMKVAYVFPPLTSHVFTRVIFLDKTLSNNSQHYRLKVNTNPIIHHSPVKELNYETTNLFLIKSPLFNPHEVRGVHDANNSTQSSPIVSNSIADVHSWCCISFGQLQ